MPKSMNDPILSILKAYAHDPDLNAKKAILLTPQGGYFLYGNRFCSIADYELEFFSGSWQIQGKTVAEPLFFGLIHNIFHAIGVEESTPERLNLIFHIDLGEGELLRGILLFAEKNARFALFCDAAVEEVYRLACRSAAGADQNVSIPPGEELQKYAENLRRNDLRALTGLYLWGKPIKPGFVENY